MVRICRAEDGEVFQTRTIHDIEGSESLEEFLRKEAGIEEAAALAYLSDGRRLTTDNVPSLAEVHDQTIFVFNRDYLDKDPDEMAKLLHLQPPLQPPIEQSLSKTRLSQLGAAFHRAAQSHLQSIGHIVESMRHQLSALRLASSVADIHVLNVSDVVADVRQELEKRAQLVEGVDETMDLASRVQIHLAFTPPVVQRVIDAGSPSNTLGHYVSVKKIRHAVEEFRGLQERLGHVEATLMQYSDGAAEGRLICADVRFLDTAVVLESSSQRLLGEIAEVTSAFDAPIVNVEPIMEELRTLDESIRDNLLSVVESKNAYTTQCLRAFRQIHTLSAGLVSLSDEFTVLQASLNTKGSFSHIERLHNTVYAYGATMAEVVRRREFSRLFHKKCEGFAEAISNLSAAEAERRQTFRDEIVNQLPFDLIGMDETLPSVEISSGVEGTKNSHYDILEKHDISDLLRDLDDEAAPVRIQENLEGLVRTIDALEMGFTNLVERSLFLPSTSGILQMGSKEQHSEEKVDDEMVHVREQLQPTINDNERLVLLECELALTRAQLAGEIATRRTLEDQLNGAIVEPNEQGKSTGHQPTRRETSSAVVQLLEIAAAYRQTSLKVLSLAYSQTNSEAEKAQGSPVKLDLSDPTRTIEVLRSFDHAGFLQTIVKCEWYDEHAKSKIAFRDFVVGDLVLFLPTRNSSWPFWTASNVSLPHYFLQVPEHLNEQLQMHEWVVARITSILERVVDQNDPESNPYALGDGVRYYMLEVEDTALLLPQGGADVNFLDKRNVNHLHRASQGRCLDIVQSLLDRKVDVNLPDMDGNTPLGRASGVGEVEISRLLLQWDANINSRNNCGISPLGRAAIGGHLDVVQLLIKSGADMSSRDDEGKTPLFLASQNDRVKVAELLLQNGANVGSRNNYGWTPLHSASNRGHLKVAELLIQHGADLNVHQDGWTPLHWASDSGHLDIVKLQLKCGADRDIRNNDNKTPLDLAYNKGMLEIVNVLSQSITSPVVC